MLSSGSFGALGMDESSDAGPSRRQVDGDEVDADWIKLIKTNHDVNVHVSDKVDLNGLPQECNLMVVSNSYGLLIVGGNQDVRIHRLSEIHKLLEDSPKDGSPTSTPLQTLSLAARPIWIRLAMEEQRLVIALADGRGINVYRLSEVVGGNTTPYHVFSGAIPPHLLDVLPNPALSSPSDQLAQYTALLSADALIIANLETCQLSSPLAGPFTSASWSSKGKQIALGTPDGRLVQYTPDGTPKAEIPPPPELEQGFQPLFTRWLENDLFLVGYANPSGQLDDPLDLYIVHRHQGSFTYTKFFDPNDVMGVPGRSSVFRHFASLRAWGERTRHLGFMISGLASEIGILHGQSPAAPAEAPKWEVLILDETARGVLPAGKGGADDTSVIGLDFDLTTTKPVVRGIQGGIELEDLSPPPRFLAYSQEGFIVSFNVQYPEVGTYPGMIKPVELSAGDGADAPMETGTNTPAQQTEPAAPPAGQSAFGSAAFSQSAFGASSTPQKNAPFGSSSFGQSSTPAGSPFASASQPATTTPAFGQSAFGQAATTSTTPTTTPAKLPATSAFGQSAFGQSSTPSAFGQSLGPSLSSPAFGQTSFGQSSKPAFGSSALGSSSAPGFGQASGSSTTPSAFGQTSQASASSPSAFNSSAFGSSSPASTSPSAFGQSAFGQSSKPAGIGQSAFGQSSQPSTSGTSAFDSSSASLGFGAFSSSKPASGFGFGASAFGQSSKPAGSPSASPFGNGGSASAFGSSSAFGSTSGSSTSSASAFSGFGQKVSTPPSEPGSAFGRSGSTTPQPPAEAAPTPPPAPAADDDFGLGGFASALEPSKGTIPGLEDSPPTPPTKLGGKPPGLEDDTPPGSPEFKPTSAFQTKPASSSSSFIKPATAFGGSPSGFGAFGSQAKAPSTVNAFGSTPTPNAFSSPPTTSTSTTSPTAFGSSAFGKTSTPVAFGQSTFGQSSKPVTPTTTSTQNAFGSSSTSSGDITGGFGAFASKTAAATDGKPSFGGFGGFASAGLGGKSAFGSAFGASANTTSGSIFGSSPKVPSPTKTPDLVVGRVDVEPSPEKTNDRPLSPLSSASPDSSTETPQAEVLSPPASPSPEESSPLDSGDSQEDVKVEETVEERESASGHEGDAEQGEPSEPAMDPAVAGEGSSISSIRDDPLEPVLEPVPLEDEEDPDAEGEYEEDDDWDDEEETDEGEDVEADEEAAHMRRASSSIEPELPSIEEEDETDEEPEVPTDTKTAKSPPPWFAKSSPEASSSTSLFSRLGPPPSQPSFGAPAMKPSSSFNLKHAARTSSPLGTQPPATLEGGSTTPPESPAKTLPPSGGLFAGPQAGKQTSLGLGKPPGVAAPVPNSGKLPFSFGKPAPEPVSTPASVVPKPAPPTIPTSFTIPARSRPPIDLPNRDNGQKSMSAVLERMILEMTDDIASIQALLKSTGEYHDQFKIPGFAKITPSDLGTHSALPFSSLSDLPDIVTDLSASLKGIDEQNALASDKLAELQSRSMKIDLQTGQVDKYLEARNDLELAARLRNDLTNEQAARRDALRDTVDDIGLQMDELERSLDMLQKRVNPPTKQLTTDAHTLEDVQRSYQKVAAAIRDQEENIDDLADRISSIRFTTPPRSRTREMSGTPGPLARRPRYSSATPSRPTPEFAIPEHVVQEIERAKERRKAVVSRLKGVTVTRVVDAASLARTRGTREPVNIDSLPEPGTYIPEAETKPSLEDEAHEEPTNGQSETPGDAQISSSAPSLSFSGISFNLDPGSVSAPATRSGGSGRGGFGSRRSHAHAPKLQNSGPSTSGSLAASPFGDFSLPAQADKKDGTPSGFFSFSGFGK